MVVPVLATRTDRTRFRDQHRRILVGTPQPPRVTDLVRQAQQGDQTAFQSLYRDRKSTRLNSSHGYISYAVFCLKKKKHSEAGHVEVGGNYRGTARTLPCAT